MNALSDEQKEALKSMPAWFLTKLKTEIALKRDADQQLTQEQERADKFRAAVGEWKASQDQAKEMELAGLLLRLEETKVDVAKREVEEKKKLKINVAAADQQVNLKKDELAAAEKNLQQRKDQFDTLKQQIGGLRVQIRMKQERIHLGAAGAVVAPNRRMRTLSVLDGGKPKESIRRRMNTVLDPKAGALLKEFESIEGKKQPALAQPKPDEAAVVEDGIKASNTPETAAPLETTDMESIPITQLCDAMMELMMDPEFKLMSAILEALRASEQDRVAKILADLYDSQEMIFELLDWTIRTEVKKTLDTGTLFRSNSMASRIMSAYARNIGQDFLKINLKPLIDQIIAKNEHLEVDPMKFVDGLIEAQRNSFVIPKDQISKNIAAILTLTQEFLQKVLLSWLTVCPLEYHQVCALLKDGVGEKFPDAWKMSIGGFVFLRLVCPIIYRPPDEFGYDFANIPNNARRTLVLIAKILQNLANYMPKFGEESMQTFSDFVEKNIHNVDKFFAAMADIPPKKVESQRMTYKTDELMKELIKILAPLHPRIAPLVMTEQRTFIQRWRFTKASKLVTVCNKMGAPVEGVRYGPTDPQVEAFFTLLTQDDIVVKAIHDSMESMGTSGLEEVELAQHLLNIMEVKQKGLQLISGTIQVHLAHQSKSGRNLQDSFPAKLFLRWSRELCADKLRDTYNSLLEVVKRSVNDLHKPTVLAVIAASFINAIAKAVPTLPTPIWRLCCTINANPALGERGVMLFLFQLLFIRALDEPELYRLSQTDLDKNCRKGLSMITEVLAACANGQEINSSPEIAMLTKESGVTLRNAVKIWLTTNGPTIGPVTYGIPWESQERAIFVIHKFIYTNLSRLTITLEQTSTDYKWVSFNLLPLLDTIFRTKM